MTDADEPRLSLARRLTSADEGLRQRYRPATLAVAMSVVGFALLTMHATLAGRLDAEAVYPDAVDYVAIAEGLVSGEGYAAVPVREATHEPTAADRTALRPPLLPGLFAVCRMVDPDGYRLHRLLEIASVSIAVGLAVLITAKLSGPVPALTLVPFAMLLADWRVREMSRSLLTEGPALCLIGLLTVLGSRLLERATWRGAIALGLVSGLTILLRTVVALWLPVVGIGVLLSGHGSLRRRAAVAGLAIGIAVLVYLPWAVRNVRVTGDFYPLGTQGAIELPAGFSDAAWSRRGVWSSESRDVSLPGRAGSRPGIDDEVAAADRNKRLALDWIAANPLKAVLLGPIKVFKEFGGHTAGKFYFWCLVGIGCWVHRRSALVSMSLTLLVACLLSVAATWSVEGRFLWPLLVPLHALAACGLWSIVALQPNNAPESRREQATRPEAAV